MPRLNITPRILDIYSGLGGASEAFALAGWEVHRLENNVLLRDVPHTEQVDVMTWPFHDIPPGYYDVIWASPPCLEFSTAYAAPRSVAARSGTEYNYDLTLLRRAIEIIKALQPTYYVIENVSGASKIFSDELGVNAPRQIVGPFFLWGCFPYLSMNANWSHAKSDNDTWSTDPLRANKRGMIPLELSKALLNSVTAQRQITEWL